MKLYHYTSLDSFSKIWKSHSLLFSESKRTNDVFESIKILEIGECKLPYKGEKTELEVQGHFNKMFWDEVGKYKQISLLHDYKDGIKGYASPMMWGHYAQNDKGVCIEIDSEKILFPKDGSIHNKEVEYTTEVPIISLTDGVDLHNKELINNYIEEHLDEIFFKKHIHWEHENEYRLVSNKTNSLDIKDAITNIYLPYNDDDDEFKAIEKLVDGSNIGLLTIVTYGSHHRKITAIDSRKLSNLLKSHREKSK